MATMTSQRKPAIHEVITAEDCKCWEQSSKPDPSKPTHFGKVKHFRPRLYPQSHPQSVLFTAEDRAAPMANRRDTTYQEFFSWESFRRIQPWLHDDRGDRDLGNRWFPRYGMSPDDWRSCASSRFEKYCPGAKTSRPSESTTTVRQSSSPTSPCPSVRSMASSRSSVVSYRSCAASYRSAVAPSRSTVAPSRSCVASRSSKGSCIANACKRIDDDVDSRMSEASSLTSVATSLEPDVTDYKELVEKVKDLTVGNHTHGSPESMPVCTTTPSGVSKTSRSRDGHTTVGSPSSVSSWSSCSKRHKPIRCRQFLPSNQSDVTKPCKSSAGDVVLHRPASC